MSTEMKNNLASAEHNRMVARRWIDAFNARDDAAEAAARTTDYIAHAPDSIQTAALDGDAWVEFLGVFLEGFPDLHLEVQDSAADEGMVAQRILFTGTHTGTFRGLPPTSRRSASPVWRSTGWSTGRSPSTGSSSTRSRSSSSSACASFRARDCCHGSWPRRSPGCWEGGGARSPRCAPVSPRVDPGYESVRRPSRAPMHRFLRARDAGVDGEQATGGDWLAPASRGRR